MDPSGIEWACEGSVNQGCFKCITGVWDQNEGRWGRWAPPLFVFVSCVLGLRSGGRIEGMWERRVESSEGKRKGNWESLCCKNCEKSEREKQPTIWAL